MPAWLVQMPAKSLAANPRQRRFCLIRCGEAAALGWQSRGGAAVSKRPWFLGKYS
jgi:hypothetical protein